MSDVTRIPDRAQQGEAHAAEVLLLLVDEELRKLGAYEMSHAPAGHTLQPAALVHEATELWHLGSRPEPLTLERNGITRRPHEEGLRPPEVKGN